MITRTANENDMAFIIDAWLRSLRDSYHVCGVTFGDWFRVMGEQIKKIMAVTGTRTLVASGSAGKLTGFICARPASNYLIYVYVIQPCRGSGLARAMAEQVGIVPRFGYGFKTPSIQPQRIPGSKFNPLPARETNEPTRKIYPN